MATNQNIAAAFKEAKKVLASNGEQTRAMKPDGTYVWEEYICHALYRSLQPGRIDAQEVILERISPWSSLQTWVSMNVVEDPSSDDMQAYRHRWLDALITEFENEGN
jgi:hypothetical protein